jgi:hypothetical protein
MVTSFGKGQLERDKQRLVFQALQPIFSQLLESATDAERISALFQNATAVMQNDVVVRDHMHLCMDYLLFPFQFVLPSIAAARQANKAQNQPRQPTACPVPAMASALAAEHALRCMHTMLALAAPQTVPQLSGLATMLVEAVHVAPGPSYNEEMCVAVLGSVRLAFARAPAAAQAALHEADNWDVTVGYLVHGLLAAAERECQGQGFGALSTLLYEYTNKLRGVQWSLAAPPAGRYLALR